MHIPPSLTGRADSLRAAFQDAKPFRHVCIDGFFEEDFADKLLAEFPAFDRRLARAEGGELGGKAVNTRIANISPSYQELYRGLSSQAFLDFVSQLSGIPDLLLDPAMFGGGTHENLNGQELDPHVDFNYDESEQLHRRLNLIVYLNKDWQPEWGGGLEIHSNPRRPDENRVNVYDPIFNRAVMFETNEYSWHGFSRISLPDAEKLRSRKSISIYLYTKERPAQEIAPRHATFYVQRPLPERFHAGYALQSEDVEELKRLLIRRDRWIEMYQQMELDLNATTADLAKSKSYFEQAVRIPVMGYIQQEGAAIGFDPDHWIEPFFKVRLVPAEPVKSIELNGFRPEGAGTGRISVLVDGKDAASSKVSEGPFTIKVPFRHRMTAPFEFEAKFEGANVSGGDGDPRALAWVLVNLTARHR
jgi:hypothetical protein